jgi:hypothetical protein
MSKIREAFNEDTFKILKGTINGVESRFVVDKTDTLYAEVKSDEVDDPQEFEEKVENSRKEFKEAFFNQRIRRGDYYLYEVYM